MQRDHRPNAEAAGGAERSRAKHVTAVQMQDLGFGGTQKVGKERLMAEAGSEEKRQVMLEDSYHVATMDNDLPVIVAESLSFVRAHAPMSSAG